MSPLLTISIYPPAYHHQRLDMPALKLVEAEEGVSARIWRRAMALAHPPLSRPRQSTACQLGREEALVALAG